MARSFNDLINGDTPVLVDLYATWCGPCQYQAPILDTLAKEVGNKAHILKIDVDKNPAVMERYGIRGVPTLMIFRKGRIVWRASGVKQQDELVRLLGQAAA